MKHLLPVVAILLGGLASALAQTSVTELSTVAQRAYLSGDMKTAKEKFGQVIELDPANKVAANYLRMIRSQEERSGQGGAFQKQLETLILPKVELRDATFAEALEVLRQQATKASEGKVAVSFVSQVPAETAAKPVTLNLTNVPFTEVLKYVGQLTGTTFSVEKFAIVVKPAPQEVVAAPPAEDSAP